jgi:ligand-binding sensor domain-containing protein
MKRRALSAIVVVMAIIAIIVFHVPRDDESYAPPRDVVWTSTREIQSLRVDENGALWAQTSGGVLRFQNGNWTKWLQSPPEYSRLKASAPQDVSWRGQKVVVSFDGLKIGAAKNNDATTIALPHSSGSHISAILPRGGALWAALFGDGIWEWNGARWKKLDLELPPNAREITALAQGREQKTLWLGTHRQGVWEYSGGQWKQHLQAGEPFAHNIQFLQKFRGAVWASTLEDGLVVRDASGWRHIGAGVLSSNAPRQLAVFKGKLYVRHSNEVADCFDGKSWRKNVFANLPRKQIISLAADEKRLYLGQWGGWSEWDGKNFVHHLKLAPLQIVPLMQIFPDGKTLWLGTENRGLFAWDFATQKLRHFDERDGLPDDWITAIGRTGSTLLAGTFNAGLAWRETPNTQWQSAPNLKGKGVTGFADMGGGSILVGTRFGLLRREANGNLVSLASQLSPQEMEVQWLLPVEHGVWIGARGALSFRTRATLRAIGDTLHS